MLKAIASVILFLLSAGATAAPLTDLERQRLIAHLEMTASWLRDEVSGLSSAQLAFRGAAGQWTILEVVDHLVVVGPVYWQDLQSALKGPGKGRRSRATPTCSGTGSIGPTARKPSRQKSRKDSAICRPVGGAPQAQCAIAAVRQDHQRRPSRLRVERQRCDAYNGHCSSQRTNSGISSRFARSRPPGFPGK